jgi:lipid-A-disaccharide synthase
MNHAAAGKRGNALRVFLVAGEESGDRLGAALMKALANSRPVSFSGVGGEAMTGQGLRSLFPIADIAIVGIDAIIARLPHLLRRIRQTAAAAVASNPDVVVIIDSPEFTHRVAKRIRWTLPSVPIVDYVSPSIWAWRPGRAKAMRGYVDHVLALLPFEPEYHRRLGGPPCTYVGHPLAEIVNKLRPDELERRRRDEKPPVVLVLPGSRRNEIARLADIFGETIRQVAKRVGPLDIIVPTVETVHREVVAAASQWGVNVRVVTSVEEKFAAFRVARAALAASGTVTLELAIAGVPTVVAYRVSPIEEFVARLLIMAKTAVLTNLILGENIMPEFLQRDATPTRLSEALSSLLDDSDARARQIEGFQRLDRVMDFAGREPSGRAAEVVLAVADAAAPAYDDPKS